MSNKPKWIQETPHRWALQISGYTMSIIWDDDVGYWFYILMTPKFWKSKTTRRKKLETAQNMAALILHNQMIKESIELADMADSVLPSL